MLTKSASFARWSKSFCWVVAAGCLLIAVATVTGEGDNRNLISLLWLAGAVVFTVSAYMLSKSGGDAGAGGR